MALYLSAEQKNLKSLFSNDDRYIIPSYQRHYSWTMEECKQLYDDVLEAFESNTDSYFLGNIVLAEGEKDDRPEVVDGQQRLITLWLYLKSLCILQPNNNRLKRMIQVESYEEESTSDYLSKISSDVFEVKDQMQIDEVLRKSVNDYEAVYDQYSDKNENLNVVISNIFNNIESSARGTASENDVKGLFDDFTIDQKRKKSGWNNACIES